MSSRTDKKLIDIIKNHRNVNISKVLFGKEKKEKIMIWPYASNGKGR